MTTTPPISSIESARSKLIGILEAVASGDDFAAPIQ